MLKVFNLKQTKRKDTQVYCRFFVILDETFMDTYKIFIKGSYLTFIIYGTR